MDGREMDWRGIFPCAFHVLAIMFCYNNAENKESLGVRHLLDRLSSWVVRARRGILAVFLILGVLSAFLMAAVQVNYDLTAYLPQDMPTTKALTLMDDTFGYTGMAQVMLEDMSIDEILEMKAQIAAVDGVSMVMWLDDVADVRAPLSTLDASVVQSYYNDGAALLTVQFADSDYSERTRAAVQEIDRLTGDNAMTGSAVTAGLLIQSSAEEVLLVVLWAIPVVLIILLFATASIAEALIFLFVLGVSVLINMGTNAFLPSISFFSQLSVAVLQMAIAMDYSIFLLSRFREERANGTDPVVAMTAAVKKAFLSISASSTTTIAGFVALMFMRYTIGWDMGLVLAKGIVFSLLSVLLVMPGLALILMKAIDRTSHRPLLPKVGGYARGVSKCRWAVLIVCVLVVVPCFIAQGQNHFVYGESAIMASEGSVLAADKARIQEKFDVYEPLAIVAPTQDIATEREIAARLSEVEGVASVQTLANVLPKGMPESLLPEMAASQFRADGYTRYVLNLSVEQETAACEQAVADIRAIVNDVFGEEAGVVGGASSVSDIREVVESDYTVVNAISIALVLLILIISFRSLLLPLILVLVIESSIWINMAIPYFQGTDLSFIGYMIVSSIQLGATVDYAILLADRYRGQRALGESPREAAISATRLAGESVLTSAGILTAGGLTVYFVSSISGIAQLGLLIGRGAALSGFMVLTVLPILLALLDRLITKRRKMQ